LGKGAINWIKTPRICNLKQKDSKTALFRKSIHQIQGNRTTESWNSQE